MRTMLPSKVGRFSLHCWFVLYIQRARIYVFVGGGNCCFGTLYSSGICLNKLFILGSPALQKTPTKGSQQGVDGAHLGGANLVLKRDLFIIKISTN